MFYTKVVGVTKRNDEEESIQKLIDEMEDCGDEGKELYLLRDPRNKHDSNAIKVLSPVKQHIGYLSASVAEELAPLIDNGEKVRVICKNITGGEDLSWGCNIAIYIGSECDDIPIKKKKASGCWRYLVYIILFILAVGIFKRM